MRTLANFSQAMSTVQAITSSTEDQFMALREESKRLGAETRFSATQAAEGMIFLARAGFDAEQVLGTIEGTLQLAQAGALELGRAADIASNVLKGFRLEVDQTARTVDVLALAANSSNTTVGQLGDALKFVAPVAAGLGVSLEETTAAIGNLSDAGLQASLAGTGLRRVLSELEAPADASIEIFNALGVAAEDVRVSQVGLTAALQVLSRAGIDTAEALQVFGQRGGPAFEVLVNSIPGVQQMTASLEEAGGTAERIAEIMDDNLNGALLRVRSAYEAFIIELGDTGSVNILTSTMNALAAALRGVAENIEIVQFAFLALAGVGIARLVVGIAASVQGLIAQRAASIASAQAALQQANASRAEAAARLAAAEAQTLQLTLARGSVATAAQEASVRAGLVIAQRELAAARAADTAATTAQTAAQNAHAAALSRTAVAARTASRVLALLGGPIGLITTALALGAAAWLTWGRNARDATQDLDQSINALVESREGPLAQVDKLLERLNSRISDTQEEINRLEQIANQGGGGRSREGERRRARSLLGPLVEGLEADLRRLDQLGDVRRQIMMELDTSLTPEPAAIESRQRAIILTEDQQEALQNLRAELTPLIVAEEQATRAEDLLRLAVQSGNISKEESEELIRRLAVAYRDVLDPLGAIHRELQQELNLRRISIDQRDTEAELINQLQTLQENGIQITEAETEGLREAIAQQQEHARLLAIEQDLYNSLVGPVQRYADQLDALANIVILHPELADAAERQRQAYENLLNPVAMYQRLLEREVALQSVSIDQRVTERERLESLARLQQQYNHLTEEQLNQIFQIEGARQRNLEQLQREEAVYQSLIGPTERYMQRLEDINRVVELHPELAERAVRAREELLTQLLETRLTEGTATFTEGFELAMRRSLDAVTNFGLEAGQIVTGLGNQISRGLGDAFGDAIFGARDLGEAIRGVARDAVSQLISELIRVQLQLAINNALAAAFNISTGGGGGLLGGLFGFHRGAVPAFANGYIPGFQSGRVGIDGPGTGTSDSILARISRGESVINADATRRNRGTLERINRGDDVERPSITNVTINVSTPDAASFRRSEGQILRRMEQRLSNRRHRDAD